MLTFFYVEGFVVSSVLPLFVLIGAVDSYFVPSMFVDVFLIVFAFCLKYIY